MIYINHLQKSFDKLTVLDDLNFKVEEGGIFAVLGPNGSGKTTFLKVLLGMVIPDKGEILLDNDLILGKWEYRKKIAYLPQIARFPDNLKVRELIDMIRDIKGVTAYPDRLIKLFKLEHSLDKRLGNLSGGTRQKVNIVLTFMFEAPLIILDEPTAGLDPVSLLQLKELLLQAKKDGKTILITSHIMSLVEELADEIIFILDGKIHFQGTIRSLMEKTGAQNLEHSIASILVA